MITPMHPLAIFLQPGGYYFADRDTRIRTVLGSCVSMTFGHPQLRVGGMCHYLLPKRDRVRRAGDWSGCYADEAIGLMLKKIDAVGASYKEYQVKLFGGGNMFPETPKSGLPQVGPRNVQAARQLVKQHGFTCVSEHLDGIGHRNVIFEVRNGEVWVKHSNVQPIAKLEPLNISPR
jgi:chemotaxis protein CheD